MVFLRHILCLFVVMLVTAFGANMAFAVPMVASEISFYQTENTHVTQGDDVNLSARAPPMAVTNVTVTGGFIVMQGRAIAVHGQEMVAALFGFGGDLSAPNNAGKVSQDHSHPPRI